MVLELLHETNLSFLLHRLVCGAILANAECVMCPDKLDWHSHKGCHTDGGLHIIREDKECAASGDNTSMQVHTNAYASHGELAYACLEEGTTESS